MVAILLAYNPIITAQTAPFSEVDLELLDLNQRPVAAGLTYRDREAVGDGYAVLFDGNPDVIYYYDDDNFYPLFTAEANYTLTFHRTVGNELWFTEQSPAGDRIVPYALNKADGSVERLPMPFAAIADYERNSTKPHLLADSTLLLWSETGLFALRPPYREARRIGDGSDATAEEERYVSLPDGRVILVQPAAALVSDGTPEGTYPVSGTVAWQTAEILVLGDTLFAFDAPRSYAVVASTGEARRFSFPGKEIFFVARMNGDSVSYFTLDDTWGSYYAYKTDGSETGTRKLDHRSAERPVSFSRGGAWIGSHRIYFNYHDRQRRYHYLYSTDLDFGDLREVEAVSMSVAPEYGFDVENIVAVEDRDLVVVRHGSNYLLPNTRVYSWDKGDSEPDVVFTAKYRIDLEVGYRLRNGKDLVFHGYQPEAGYYERLQVHPECPFPTRRPVRTRQ